jgi:trimeric autotransporter adhesin
VRRNLLAFRDVPGTTGALSTFDPRVDGPVTALALGGSRLYLGGDFTRVGGAARGNLVAVDAESGAVSGFRADVDAPVRALAASSSTVYAGGDFTLPRKGLIALEAGGGAVRPWKADTDAPVRALALTASQLIVGGDFTAIGGAARTHLAALAPSNGSVAPWAPRVSPIALSPVRALATTAAGGVVVGGDFMLPFGPVRADRFALFAP